MSAAFLIKNLIATVVLPPLIWLILGLVGCWLLSRRPRLGRGLLLLALTGLWLSASPWVAKSLIQSLEIPPQPITGEEADAIVILGGGVRPFAPEYGGSSVHGRTLERLRYGAWLHRRTGRPILVTGGSPTGAAAEAPLMRRVLEEEFRVPVTWSEANSDNTHENARFSARLLRASGISRIYLVTHAWHLPRARLEFEREGLQVVPAGTDFSAQQWDYPFEYLPNAQALVLSFYASHEWLGRLWARING